MRIAFVWSVVWSIVFFCATPVHAQESLTLSVTPPLYQLNVAPGDSFKTTLKVINNNPYELTLYAEIADFSPDSEGAHGMFIPFEGEFDPAGPTLSSWMQVASDPIVLPPEQSLEIPVTLVIPADASPGGHYAAILVGTRPPRTEGSAVRTSQVVTSLFFLRVAGDVIEQGSIREFSVAHLFREAPQAQFGVRFQNTGNVHVQPQGQITIRNMWGKERGVIPINQKSHFGNVLPGTIRRFDFSWEGEQSLADIGLYTAELTLSFGENARQNVTAATRFFVIPIRGVLVTLGLLTAFIGFVIWAVRRYVRRVLTLSGYAHKEPVSTTATPARTRPLTRRDMVLPLREGVLDLRSRIKSPPTAMSPLARWISFVRTYRSFFVSLAVVVCFVVLVSFFFRDVLQRDKNYEVTLTDGDQSITLTDDQILNQVPASPGSESETGGVRVGVIDASGRNLLSAVRDQLAGGDYAITHTETIEQIREHSAIVFNPFYASQALEMSRVLGDVALSARDAASTSTDDITLYIGSDMVK